MGLPQWCLPAGSKPKEIMDFVNQHGIAVLENYISDNSLLTRAQEEALEAVRTGQSVYNFGHAVRFADVPAKYAAIRKILTMPDLIEIVRLSGRKREEVFITHEFISGVMERNGYLHFDRTNTFKLFFYLFDTDEDCGPFRAVIDTKMVSRKLRQKEWVRTSDYAKIRNRPPIDYPDLGYTEDSGDPVLGPAGTLIIFDTDTLHKGGLITQGHQRLILRTHNR